MGNKVETTEATTAELLARLQKAVDLSKVQTPKYTASQIAQMTVRRKNLLGQVSDLRNTFAKISGAPTVRLTLSPNTGDATLYFIDRVYVEDMLDRVLDKLLSEIADIEQDFANLGLEP